MPAAVVAALLWVGLASGGEVIDPEPVFPIAIAAPPAAPAAAAQPMVAATPRPATAPSPANRFFGTVTAAGMPAAAGTPIVAMIGAAQCGSAQVQAGGTYSIDVASANTMARCGVDGSTVSFTVGGRPAGTGTWAQGAFTSLNLSAQSATSTSAPPPVAIPARVVTAAPSAVPGSLAAPALSVDNFFPASALFPPMRVTGTVTFAGEPASTGTPIIAWIGSTMCGMTIARAAGRYVLDIAAAPVVPGCGADGASVTYTVAGAPAAEHVPWIQGRLLQLDLAAYPHPNPRDTLPPKSSVEVIGTQLEAAGEGHSSAVIRFNAIDQTPIGVLPSEVRMLEVIEDGERLPCRIRDRCTVRETVPGVHVFEFWAVDYNGNEEEHQMLILEMDETGVSVRFP
jgi:hypothetical protein